MIALAALTGLPLLALLFAAYLAVVLLLARACGLRRTVEPVGEDERGEPAKAVWSFEATCDGPGCWCNGEAS